MLDDDLDVYIREREGVAIIDLIGDVTTFAEEKITNAYNEVSRKGARNILLNFRQNDYINRRWHCGTELEFVIMVIAVSCVKLLSAHNSTQHTSRKHKGVKPGGA
jgi:hypothetical protein